MKTRSTITTPQARIQGRWNGEFSPPPPPFFSEPPSSFFFLSLKYWNNIWFFDFFYIFTHHFKILDPSLLKERPAITLRSQPNIQPAMLDLSTQARDRKLKKRLADVVQQVATSGNLLNGTKLYFRSTTFNGFHDVEWHISTFNITRYKLNICWTAVAIFLLNKYWTVFSVPVRPVLPVLLIFLTDTGIPLACRSPPIMLKILKAFIISNLFRQPSRNFPLPSKVARISFAFMFRKLSSQGNTNIVYW